MDYFAGLDVSVKETSVCIVDNAGKIVREARVASEPEALLQVLTNTIYRLKRVGLEAGPLSQWLYSCLAEAGLPVICVETRHMRAVLRAKSREHGQRRQVSDKIDPGHWATLWLQCGVTNRVRPAASGPRSRLARPNDAVDFCRRWLS